MKNNDFFNKLNFLRRFINKKTLEVLESGQKACLFLSVSIQRDRITKQVF